MARLHSRKKGMSGSRRPTNLTPPEWVTRDAEWVRNKIIELARAGNSPSMIGIILRDQYGVPLAKMITGKKITDILAEENLTFKLPEDLRNLIEKAVNIRKHLETNKKDFSSKRGLQLTESKIRRLVKYYKKQKKLPPDWKYNPKDAAILIR